MSMSDDVAGATLQVSTRAAETAITTAGNVVNKTIDNIAKLLQALSAKREAARASGVTSTDLTELRPGEVSVQELRNNAINNRENIVFSDNGFTAEDKRILLHKARDYGIPIAFQHEHGKDNYYASVRSSDLPIFRRMCTELLQDKMAERPQELGNFKCKEWEIPYLTRELNQYDLPAQFGKTKNGEHFCLYDKSQEKTMLIARGLFINKCKDINNSILFDRDEEGYLTIKDSHSGKEVSFEFDKIPSREQLSHMVNIKFGYNDINKADLVAAKFGEEMLEGANRQKFFSKDPMSEFSKVETNVELEGESVLVKPYACWRLTPKTDDVPKIVYRDDNGRFAVIDPGTMTRAEMTEVIKTDMNITDDQTVAAMVDKAVKVNDYYSKQAEENFVYDKTFDKNDFDLSHPELYGAMHRTDADGNAFVKKLPVDDVTCDIERDGKDSFTVSSAVTTIEYAEDGTAIDNVASGTLTLSLSDKKNAIADITNMLKNQGVPEVNAKQIARECFARAENQSAEKVVHLEEVRGERPFYGENSDLQVDFKVGNKRETINVTDAEKAKKDLIDTFGVSEVSADAAIDQLNSKITEREVTVLSRFGFNDTDNWSMDEAADVISRIEDNGWQVPDYIDPATYKPGSIDFGAIDNAVPELKIPEVPKMPVPTAGRSR